MRGVYMRASATPSFVSSHNKLRMLPQWFFSEAASSSVWRCGADSSKPAPSIESHQITEEPSTAVSDAAVTIGGLTMREMVDAPQPINDSDGSYTAMLEQATGVEAVEGTASFVTAEGEDSPGTEKSPGAAEQQASTGRKSAEIVDKGDMRNVPVSPSGTALLAHYEEQDDQDDDDEEDFESVGTPYTGTPYSGLDTTRTVGAQSLAFMEGGQRYHHRPEARFVPDVRLPALYVLP